MGTRDDVLRDKIEVSLDGRQVFYLFFGATVVCALVFVLGVMIGRRVEARSRHVAAAELTQDPLAALDQLEAQGKNEALLFPKALAGDRELLEEVDQKLEDSVPSATPAAEVVNVPVPEAAPVAAPPEAVVAEPAPVPAPALKPDKVEKPAAIADKPAAVADKPAADKPTPEKSAEKPPTEAKPGKGKFTLQLSSFQDRAEAEGYAAKLKSAGFQPYLAEAEVEGRGKFYRVRVGKYPSFDAAVEAKAGFEKKVKTIAYVTRLPD